MEMINELSAFNSNGNDKISKLVEIIKKASEATHTVLLVSKNSQKAICAIECNDKKIMWGVLQEYLRQYILFINSFTFLTNIRVNKVSSDYYDSITADNIAKQLQVVIQFIYVQELVNNTNKCVLKNKVKSELEHRGIFTKEELSFIL